MNANAKVLSLWKWFSFSFWKELGLNVDKNRVFFCSDITVTFGQCESIFNWKGTSVVDVYRLTKGPWHGLAGSSRSLGVSRSRNQDITIDSITNASRSLLNFAGQGLLTRCPNFKNFWLVFNLWFRVVYEITSIVWTGNLDWNFAIWIKYFHIVKLQWKFTDMFRISCRVLKLK